jgi:hypothetical protein
VSALRSRIVRLEASQPSASLLEARVLLADLGAGLAVVAARLDGHAGDFVPGPALVRFASAPGAGCPLLGRLASALAGVES